MYTIFHTSASCLSILSPPKAHNTERQIHISHHSTMAFAVGSCCDDRAFRRVSHSLNSSSGLVHLFIYKEESRFPAHPIADRETAGVEDTGVSGEVSYLCFYFSFFPTFFLWISSD